MLKKVTIELTEAQAKIVLQAVEEWFRLRMGQHGGLAHDLAFYGYKYKKGDDDTFNNAIAKQAMLDGILDEMFHIAFTQCGKPRKVEPDVTVASDIWSALRYELSYKSDRMTMPFQLGEEPLPKITVKEVEP